MTEYTPRQYADAAMYLASGIELSNADQGTLARMMRTAIRQGFNPNFTDADAEKDIARPWTLRETRKFNDRQWARMVLDAGSEATEDEERRARRILRLVPPTR